MPKKKADEESGTLGSNKMFLESIYDKAVAEGRTLFPDGAIKEWVEFHKNAAKVEQEKIHISVIEKELQRFDEIAMLHKLHRYAVDLFYKHYFPRKSGAPPLSKPYLAYLRFLDDLGFSNRQLALQENPQLEKGLQTSQAKDKMRKRVKRIKR
jgi:hypothetical protein